MARTGRAPRESGRESRESRAALEQGIRSAWQSGDLSGAITLALRGYGPEILGVLTAVSKSEEDAREAFAQFSEDLWKGIAGFEWRSSFRTWAYGIAHNASLRTRSGKHRRVGRNVPLSETSIVSELAVEVRDRTLPYLRTEVKDEFTRLRESLEPDDQLLLILRVDKQMSWDEIAGIVSDDTARANEAALRKKSAQLRKRFQILKEHIRERARAMGLLKRDERD
jgi:RNA polymerase sigma-70 factor (ECF subfamily)